MLRGYFSLCMLESILAVLRGLFGMQGIEPRWAVWKQVPYPLYCLSGPWKWSILETTCNMGHLVKQRSKGGKKDLNPHPSLNIYVKRWKRIMIKWYGLELYQIRLSSDRLLSASGVGRSGLLAILGETVNKWQKYSFANSSPGCKGGCGCTVPILTNWCQCNNLY